MSYWYYQYLQVEQAHTQNSDGEFKKTSILILYTDQKEYVVKGK